MGPLPNTLTHLLNEYQVAGMLRLSVASVRRWRLLGRRSRHLKIGVAVPYTREDIPARVECGLSGANWNCGCRWIVSVNEMIGSVNEILGVGSVLGTPAAGISRAVHAAVSALDRVHRVPQLARPVPVVSDAEMVEAGKYRWDRETGRPLDIRLNPGSDHPELTAVLEIGHLLDHQAIGVAGEFASLSHPRLARWRKAIDSTRAVWKLEELREAGSIPFRFSDGMVRQVRVRHAASELLHPWELFSRSYAQFISGASGSAKLASQIHGFRTQENPSSVVPRFWDEDDFGDVLEAVESLIVELAWKRRVSPGSRRSKR
jgi:hypothetical protein